MQDSIAYKVLTAAQHERFEREGSFAGSEVDLADGFIHMSTAAQLDETVRRHFAGATGLVVAAIDLTRLGDAVRWEPSRGGALFPHLYGVLALRDVVARSALERDEAGRVRLPG
jgi:uncharacterized protein (DUF952 family)